jgi:NADPH-dependent curcumin reductase CurA
VDGLEVTSLHLVFTFVSWARANKNTDEPSYLPPIQIGDIMRGNTISRVLATKTSKAKVGDIVYTMGGWCEFSIVPEMYTDVPKTSKVLDYLGVCGIPGLTAFFGLEKIGQPKAGDTVVVSGAAGATGSVVGQIAKLMGARVVGIAGSDEKCEWLKDVGFDVALNYKDPSFQDKLIAATPDFIDVYWDNGTS